MLPRPATGEFHKADKKGQYENIDPEQGTTPRHKCGSLPIKEKNAYYVLARRWPTSTITIQRSHMKRKLLAIQHNGVARVG